MKRVKADEIDIVGGCDDSTEFAYFGGGKNDNSAYGQEAPNYGEVSTCEITDDDEATCWGAGNGDGAGLAAGNGDGAGLAPIYDVFDEFTDEEIIELNRWACGDIDARTGARPDGAGINHGRGDGWGKADGSGRTVSCYSHEW